MQVFGNSGARTIKDLLADAETPRKRSLSARTGGGGDFSHGGSEAGDGCRSFEARAGACN